MYNMIQIINTAFFTLPMRVVKGVNPQSSYHKGKNSFFLFPKPFPLRVLKTTLSASARQQGRALKMPGSFTFRPATYPQNWLEISPQDSKMMEN